MRKLLLAAGLAAAALIPSLAFAQTSCEQQRDNHVAGTVVGAGLGALLGDAIAPRGDKVAGTVIGAVGGGVIGNAATRPQADCAHAYGYYDHANQWHANAVSPEMASGYYDRDGGWVDGAPNGAYDQNNQWVASNAAGYYDQTGHWIAGPANGAYDSNGHWMRGAVNGHRDAGGLWVMDAQPGYYDGGGHWRAGVVQGHYDDRGVWIPTAMDRPAVGLDLSDRPHRDIDRREAWLERRIHSAAAAGTLSQYDSDRALARLGRIRQHEAGLRDDDGRLSVADDTLLQARLDRLDDSLGLSNDSARAAY